MRNLRLWIRIGVVAGGASLILLGVILAYRTADAAAAASTMIIVGALLVVSPALLDRFETIGFSAAGFELSLTRSVAELGAPAAAKLIERTDLAAAAGSYSFVREQLGAAEQTSTRIVLQDALVAKASGLSTREKFPASEVRLMLRKGSPVMRVLAIGLMKGDTSLADGATVLNAISKSQTGNEQYHALLLAKLCWRELETKERKAILAAIDDDPYIDADTDRKRVADELRELGV